MGLRDEIKKIVARFFGTKRLTSVSEIEKVAVNDTEIWDIGVSEFDKRLKVEITQELQGNKFSAIKDEARREILMSVENFKNNILNSEEIEKIKSEETHTGEANGQSFICIAEMADNGEISSTIIVTANSCSKTTIDENGNTTYQESRMVNGIMKTIVSDDKGRSLTITGNFSQEEIEKIKKFSESNKSKLNDIKQFKTEEEKTAYLSLLLNKTPYVEGNDFLDREKYLSSCWGKRVKEDGVSVLKEMDFVLDKNNINSNPLVVSLNTLKEGKVTRQRFRLTNDGKYIDESSFKLNDKGEPEYTEMTFEDLKEYFGKQGLNMNYIGQVRKHQTDEKPMIPPGAMNIHKAMQAEIEKGIRNVSSPSVDEQIK